MVSALLRWWRRRHQVQHYAAHHPTLHAWRGLSAGRRELTEREVRRKVVQLAERAERIRRRA